MATVDLNMSLSGINKYGGQFWAYKRSTESTWHIGTYISKQVFGFEEPIKDVTDVSGAIIDQEFDATKAEFKFTTMQSDPDTLRFFKNETKNVDFEIYVQWESAQFGKYKADMYIPKARLSTGFSLTVPGKEFDFTIKPLDNLTSATLNPLTTSLSAFSVTSSVTVAAHDYFDWNI